MFRVLADSRTEQASDLLDRATRIVRPIANKKRKKYAVVKLDGEIWAIDGDEWEKDRSGELLAIVLPSGDDGGSWVNRSYRKTMF